MMPLFVLWSFDGLSVVNLAIVLYVFLTWGKGNDLPPTQSFLVCGVLYVQVCPVGSGIAYTHISFVPFGVFFRRVVQVCTRGRSAWSGELWMSK
jgi:hypothetical protein